MTLGHTEQKNAVLDAYYAKLRSWAEQLNDRGFLETQRARVHHYASVLRAVKGENPLEDVGRAFAKLVDQKDNLDVRHFGVMIFNSMYATVQGILESIDITG